MVIGLASAMVVAGCGAVEQLTGTDDPTTDPTAGTSDPTAQPTAEPTAPPVEAAGATVLDVEYSVITLDPAQQQEIDVDALVDGEPTTISASDPDSNCASIVPGADRIVVISGGSACTTNFTVTADGVDGSHDVTVNVVDPMSMDIGEGLVIRYVNDFQFRWHDGGSGADLDTGMYHPIAPAGFYPLGTFIWASHGSPNDQRVAIVAADTKGNGTLAAPTDYTFLWNDAGSGSDNDGAAWQPVCPAGFNAMGVVATSGAKPSTEDVRCVADRYSIIGEAGTFVTNDAGSGGDRDLSVNTVGAPAVRLSGGRSALGANTFQINGSKGHFLAFAPPIHTESARRLRPSLTGCEELTAAELGTPYATRATRVPFTMLPANIAGKASNADTSPFFILRRETTLVPGNPPFANNCDGQTGRKVTVSTTTGQSNTSESSFSQELGITSSASGDIGPVSTSIEISVTLAWSQSDSQTYSSENTVTEEKCVPPGHFGQFLSSTTTFTAINQQGNSEGTVSIGLAGIDYLEWPQNGLTEEQRGALCG